MNELRTIYTELNETASSTVRPRHRPFLDGLDFFFETESTAGNSVAKVPHLLQFKDTFLNMQLKTLLLGAL
jgi:hypothetical protein